MDDDQQFCLRWNNHQSTLISQFDTQFENENLVDCTLAAEGKYVRAHKMVLSACSPYFEALIKLHYDKHPVFILNNVKYQELRAMMDYMYRGEVNISQDQLGAILKAAESLQIKGLSDGKGEKKQPRPATPPPPAFPKSSSLSVTKQAVKQQRSTVDSQSDSPARETSASPTPRKRKKLRRRSEDENLSSNFDNHSNASSVHSQPSNIKPIAKVPVAETTTALVNINQIILDQNLTVPSSSNQTNQSEVTPKEEPQPHSELILELKPEVIEDEGNADYVEDLTLEDDDELDDYDQSQGPSNMGEGSSEGFSWQMDNADRNPDEVFMAAQAAAAAGQGDSQEYAVPRLVPRHFPERIPGTASQQRRKRCVVCYKLGKRKDTMFWCSICRRGLCSDVCFKIYHTPVSL